MKKYGKIILPLASLLPLACLAGCGNSWRNNYAYDLDFNVDVKGTTIDFWAGFGSDISDVLGDLLKEFTKKTGVKVNYESKSSYNDCLKAVNLAATSGGYPNLVVGYPDHFASYVKNNIIVRLDYYLANDVHNATFEPEGENFKLDDFYSDYLKENQCIEYDEKGKPYTLGIPFNKSTEVMIYNKTFFDWCATQQDLASTIFVPETYDQVDSVGKAVLSLFETKGAYGKHLLNDGTVSDTVPAGKKSVIDLHNIKAPEAKPDASQFRPFSYDSQANLFITTVRQHGGTYTTYDKQTQRGYLAFDSQETRNGLNMIKTMHDEKTFAIPADFGESKYGSNPFKANKCVLTLGSSAGVANSSPSAGKFEIAAAPVPYKTADKKFVISQGANLALLDKGSREQRVASWQLIKFLTKYANGVFCSQTGYYPTCKYAEQADLITGKAGMWAGYDETVYSDYATWLASAKESINETDRIRAQTAEVNLNHYVNETKNWQKFMDQPFSGSADVREGVAKIVPWIVTGEKTVDQAIQTSYSELRDYVR